MHFVGDLVLQLFDGENPWAPEGFVREHQPRDGPTHFSDFFLQKSVFIPVYGDLYVWQKAVFYLQ